MNKDDCYGKSRIACRCRQTACRIYARCQQLGHEVVVIAVVSDVEPELAAEADAYYEINVAKLDKVIKTLKKNGVAKVTMIGKVTKEILFKGLKFPDWRAIKLLAKLRNRKDDTIMLAIVEELAKDGLEVVDQTLT